MNQIIKTKQFSPKQYPNSNKKKSLNSLTTPNFWNCDGFSSFSGKNIEILKF